MRRRPPLGTSGGGAVGGDSSTDTSGTPTETQTFFYTYAADVRFGKEGNLDRKTLSQFRSLPSSEDPVVVFMGVREDGETAIFLLSSAATSTGEGNCEPDDTCTFLYMKDGDEQRIEAVNEQRRGRHLRARAARHRREAHRRAREGDELEPQQAVEALGAQRRGRKGARTNPFARGFQAIGF